MQLALSAEPQETPALYRKEFLKNALGRLEFITAKVTNALKTSEKHLSSAKDMLANLTEEFAKANLPLTYMIKNPGKPLADTPTYNKNVLFEFTPAQMQALKQQLADIDEGLSNGIIATNDAEFKTLTADALKTLKETVAKMTELCGSKQQQR